MAAAAAGVSVGVSVLPVRCTAPRQVAGRAACRRTVPAGGIGLSKRPSQRLGGRRLTVFAQHTGNEQKPAETTPKPPAKEEDLPWVRSENKKEQQGGFKVPYPVYLLGSVIVAIAAVGSIYEWAYKNPVFGVLYPDSPLYNVVLGIFVFTGFPSAGFLWWKAAKAANEMADEQDREDGYY
eukprot:jgi/Chlat1/7079/Chrsp57S06769